MPNGLQQKNNREDAQKTCHQNTGHYEAIQGRHRQQNVVFSLDGFDRQTMLQQCNGQQRQTNADEDHASDVSCGFSAQWAAVGPPLAQTSVNLINRNANADQAQAGANPGIDGALGSGTIAFLGQLIGRTEQLLGLRLTHRIQAKRRRGEASGRRLT